MSETTSVYTLKICDTSIESMGGRSDVIVRYEGAHGIAEIREPLAGDGLDAILATCERIAQRIFQDEFRLNSAVELNFALADENGIKIWHTQPTLYMKCPLTMSMKWSCSHLNDIYKTMTTLGVIELPEQVSLDGNMLGAKETIKVIMESMGSGVEFMGNVLAMRQSIDHDYEKSRQQNISS